MTPEVALKLVDGIVAQVAMSRASHLQAHQAIAVLAAALSAKDGA